jgi:SAM-dependent methyltransferase
VPLRNYCVEQAEMTEPPPNQADEDEEWGQKIQSQQYWEDRYQNDSTSNTMFEWYLDYDSLSGLLEGIIPKTQHRVLEIGCGNSELALGLYNAGYNVVASDYAKQQILHLQQQYQQQIQASSTATTTATATAATSPTLTFDHVDCRQLWDKYGAEAFQAVVDKACLDSMLSGGEEGKIIAMETCKQVDRILRDGGHFVVVSHAHPETALGKILMVECVLSNVDTATARWSVDIHSTEEDSSDSEDEEEEVGGIHVYVFKKVVRARTRSLKRKRLRFSDDDFRIERHFH